MCDDMIRYMTRCATLPYGALQQRSDHMGLHVTSSYIAVAAFSLILVCCYSDVTAKSNHALHAQHSTSTRKY